MFFGAFGGRVVGRIRRLGGCCLVVLMSLCISRLLGENRNVLGYEFFEVDWQGGLSGLCVEFIFCSFRG